MFAILDRTAQAYPNQTAILFQGRELKYHQLKRQVDSLANALARLGLKKGDRVCLFLPNCPEFVLSYWAVLKAGGVVVPTSILRTDEGLLHEVSSSASRFMVCQAVHLDRGMALRDRHQSRRNPGDFRCGYDQEQVQVSLPKGVYDLAALIATHDPPLPRWKSTLSMTCASWHSPAEQPDCPRE